MSSRNQAHWNIWNIWNGKIKWYGSIYSILISKSEKKNTQWSKQANQQTKKHSTKNKRNKKANIIEALTMTLVYIFAWCTCRAEKPWHFHCTSKMCKYWVVGFSWTFQHKMCLINLSWVEPSISIHPFMSKIIRTFVTQLAFLSQISELRNLAGACKNFLSSSIFIITLTEWDTFNRCLSATDGRHRLKMHWTEVKQEIYLSHWGFLSFSSQFRSSWKWKFEDKALVAFSSSGHRERREVEQTFFCFYQLRSKCKRAVS